MKRRTFLKMSALAAATAAAAQRAAAQDATAEQPVPSDVKERVGDGVKWDKAPCRFCGTGCHVQVGVEDDKVVAIAGDQLADVNKGLLCVKGYHVALALYGGDRLTTPQLRNRTTGELEPISWERALQVIAERVEKDPKGFAFYGSGQWTIPEGYAAQKFMKGGLTSNHIDPNARLCMASAVTGFLAAYGVDEPAGCYQDLDECDVLILWGNNMAEMHPVIFSRFIDRRSRGEDVTLIDLTTRTTRSSEHADHVLYFKPQTDLAIANGIAHLLLKKEKWRTGFVEKHCAFKKDSDPRKLHGESIDFDEYRKLLEPYTPEYVEELSGVPADDIRMLADLFADSSLRITSTWCMGMNQHTEGTAINTLVHGIHLLSGHFGRPGDAPTSLTGQPSACGTVREVGTLGHGLPGGLLVAKKEHRRLAEEFWNLPEGRIEPKPGHHTVEMWKQFCTPAGTAEDGTSQGGIHTIWVQVTNPGQTLPNLGKLFVHDEVDDDKFLIVSDVYPTATTAKADLVLPSAMWVEKNGMFGNSERRTQQWFKMVEPPGDARDDAWQVIAAARTLYDRGFEGMRDKDGDFIFEMKDEDGTPVPVWEWERYYDVNVDRALFEEYRSFTSKKHKNLAPYDEYVKARGMRWPVVQRSDGSWRETRFRFAGFDDPFVPEGEEFDFYHSPTKDGRAQIWFRPYTPPPEVPDDEYPLWLCTGRVLEHWHSGTMTMRIPPLRDSVPQAYVEVHPDDAAERGISNGDLVVVETRRGSLTLPVWLNGRGKPRPGNIFVPFFDERLLINELTLEEYDPFSKQPDYKKCAARIRKAESGDQLSPAAPSSSGGQSSG